MKTRIRRQLAAGKRRIEKRLDKIDCEGCDSRCCGRPTSSYEMAERTQGMTYGGMGSMLLLVRQLGLAEAIDRRLHLLKIHLPYHESDHVLNLAYNALCDGTCLEDIELRRNDEVYLDALGARRIPDPTTAGDFCRRFQARRRAHAAWTCSTRRGSKSGRSSRRSSSPKRASTWTARWWRPRGECKQGMDIAYNGIWGYHPLVVIAGQHGRGAGDRESFGQSAQPRGRPRKSIACWRFACEAAFAACCCGATPTSRRPSTWIAGATTRGCGSSSASMPRRACTFGPTICRNDAWKPLDRPARYQVKTQPRGRRENVKEQIVVAARVREHPPDRRGGGRVRLSPGRLPEDVSPDRGQEVSRHDPGPVAVIRRLPLLLLPDQRPHQLGGRDRAVGQRPLRSGEPARATQRRGAGLAGAGRQPGEQLGLHGDDRAGLEPEGLVGAVAARAAGPRGEHSGKKNSACCGWNSKRF